MIAFGSGKKADGDQWMLDTVLVVRDSCPYDPSNELEFQVPDAFIDVTGRPLADNPGKGEFRLYRGATPDDPVGGMFSFFPAMPASGNAGFPRPFISLPDESFNPRNSRAPKGHGRNCRDRTLNELRGLWCSLVTQVHHAGLVLGTSAEVPPRRAHTGASNYLNTDGSRSTSQAPLRAPGCGRCA